MIKLIILDRDGVLNEDRTDYVKTLDELVILDGAAEAVALAKAEGIRITVATNQSCIGKGIISEYQLASIHHALQTALAAKGATLDAIYYCPDATESPRRKPQPGMLLEAMRDFRTTPAETLFIGDAQRDLEAARRAGCHAILVRTGKGRETETMLPEDYRNIPVYDSLYPAMVTVLENRTMERFSHACA